MKKTMKMLLSVVLIITMVAISSLFAFAESTTLTTTVPPATYTLTVPLNAVVEYGTPLTSIDAPKIATSEGFGEGKDLKLTIIREDFKCPDTTTTIPYEYQLFVSADDEELVLDESNGIYFRGTSTGKLEQFARSGGHKLSTALISVDNTDWPKALAGDYTATITYVTEVVAD